ncbi:MAG TPA: Hpt domain-containing protein [Xanthobacteraceae bacterium]|jgi:HPt (histidine-containing phosphotransfer) domain-containing protein
MDPSGDANGDVQLAGRSGASASTAAWSVNDRSALLPEDPTALVIDRNHLARMTLGDGNLERELLGLFHRQAGMLLGRMTSENPKVVAAFAHTLTGSARGVGAWQVAAAAEAIERAATGADEGRLASALRHLSAAVTRAQAAIADLTQAC